MRAGSVYGLRLRIGTGRVRFSKWFLALILTAPGLSGVARADVLEVGSDGHRWIAGRQGPAASELVSGDLHRRSLTEIARSAGPRAWRARVAELAVKYDISAALPEAVVWQESRWNERAVSPAGARGLAQLMPGTARMMGVDPDDPSANLEGGARYLRLQLDEFDGDIERALAAYNAGPGRVKKAGGIPAIRETQDYVASIMFRLSTPVRE